MKRTCIAIATSLPFVSISPASAQQLELNLETLEYVNKMADDICEAISLKGENSTVNADGEVGLEIAKILRGFVDADISGKTSVNSEKFTNLSQAALDEIVRNKPELLGGPQCHERNVNMLLDRIERYSKKK